MADTARQTRGFETEVKQLMHLVVHSLYSNKEIFLRELISNASDANDKLRFAGLSNAALFEDNPDLKIWLSFDEKARTITLTDNGIGMNRDEVISHLGTIAKSGTKEFLSNLTGDEAKDSHLIGQFGVGFYSAFIIADKVTVKTRRAGDSPENGVVWESEGDGSYTIETKPRAERGSEIILHLKPEEDEFLSYWRLKNIVTKYSDHISWPIVMEKPASESEEEASEEKPASPEEETVNRATALWTRNKSEIKAEEYNELYKHISHDFEEPLRYSHNHVEGKQHYTSLLYVPKRAPFDLFQPDFKHGLKLYVKRVFIMDDADQFLPRYLRFVKGVIDSSDLPLNVSREILQENKLTESIKNASVKRILGMLEKLAKNEPERYQDFWQAFGLVLKEGPIEDQANREQVAGLLRFSSTHNDSKAQTVSLKDYIERMQAEQDKIYFISASSFNAAKNSPHLEIFRKKGIEVLLLSDRIDEWLTTHLGEFDGKRLQSVTKGALDLEDEGSAQKTEEKSDAQAGDNDSVLSHIKTVLGERIKDARITHRLTQSPACVVADDNDMGLEMHRMLKMAGQEVPEVKPIFEINPEHGLFGQLKAETDDDKFADLTLMLFEQSLLAEGGVLDDPADFVARVNRLLLA